MFDIGWWELLLLAVLAILVVGPKELPNMLRSLGRTVSKLKQQASEFRHHFDEMMRESDMEDIKHNVENLRRLNPIDQVKTSIKDAITDTGPSQSNSKESQQEKIEDAHNAKVMDNDPKEQAHNPAETGEAGEQKIASGDPAGMHQKSGA